MAPRERIRRLVARLRTAPGSATFAELTSLCDFHFTFERQRGSHRIYSTGLSQPALVNIQPRGKMAKSYQVRQVLSIIDATAGEPE